MIEITLPWPAAGLSPNARMNHMAKWEIAQAARATAKLAAIAAGWKLARFPDGRIPMTLVFHFPDNRHRDADNCLASMKPALDGLCDALEINDERLWPITLDHGKNVKAGQVVVRIGEPLQKITV